MLLPGRLEYVFRCWFCFIQKFVRWKDKLLVEKVISFNFNWFNLILTFLNVSSYPKSQFSWKKITQKIFFGWNFIQKKLNPPFKHRFGRSTIFYYFYGIINLIVFLRLVKNSNPNEFLFTQFQRPPLLPTEKREKTQLTSDELPIQRCEKYQHMSIPLVRQMRKKSVYFKSYNMAVSMSSEKSNFYTVS